MSQHSSVGRGSKGLSGDTPSPGSHISRASVSQGFSPERMLGQTPDLRQGPEVPFLTLPWESHLYFVVQVASTSVVWPFLTPLVGSG